MSAAALKSPANSNRICCKFHLDRVLIGSTDAAAGAADQQQWKSESECPVAGGGLVVRCSTGLSNVSIIWSL